MNWRDLRYGEGFETGELEGVGTSRDRSHGQAFDRFGDGADVIGRGAAAAADQIDESGLGEVFEVFRHVLGGLVVAAKGIR